MKMKQTAKMGMIALILVVFAAGIVFSNPDKEPGSSPDEAVKKLMEGNRRYVENKMSNGKTSGPATRASLATSQKPFAVILTCSDSRVPPEIIFDQGLGQLFVVRVAGNIVDPVILGSIEYAAEHLGSSLIMVLGHERCGAVTATVEAKGKTTGSRNIDAIVSAVEPGVRQAMDACDACKGVTDCPETRKSEFVECVIDANAKIVAAGLTNKSAILKHLAEEKKITIMAARYDLDDGTVTPY